MARIGYGLIFGGGLANLVDRVVFEGVLDFIDLHVGGLHWPAFNVADLAITYRGHSPSFLLTPKRRLKACFSG
jgi:signal peptidase II